MVKPEPTREMLEFFKNFSAMESKTELFVSIGLYVMLTLTATALLDKYIDVLFDRVEGLLPMIDPMNKGWLFLQVTIQLFLSIIISFVIRQVTGSLVYEVGRRKNPGFGMFDKHKAGAIIFAFVLFFAQSNLKEKLKAIVPKF